MNDREFLMWIHERLVHVHGDSQYKDFMHKLRAVIRATPADQATPNVASANDIDELRALMGRDVIERRASSLKAMAAVGFLLVVVIATIAAVRYFNL